MGLIIELVIEFGVLIIEFDFAELITELINW